MPRPAAGPCGGATSVRDVEIWSPSHAVSKDSVRMKDPLFCFMRDLVLILAPWPGSRVTACHPHEVPCALLTEGATLGFLAKISLLPCAVHLRSTRCFLCTHPLSLPGLRALLSLAAGRPLHRS